MTELLNSTTLKTERFGFIRPTAAERAAGRLMRAPDHDASGDAGAAPADSSADAGAGSDAGAGASGADAGDGGGEADAGTVLGSATADDGAGDGKGDDKPTATPAPAADDNSVPEAYELKLTTTNEAGEETAVDLDPALVEAATPILKEAGVSQDAANKLITLVPEIQKQLVKQQEDGFASIRSEWAKEAQDGEKNPDIGGANWKDTIRLSAKALDTFGAKSEVVDGKETNPFRVLLNESGLGNHPDLIRFMRNVGAAASEDNTLIRNTSQVEVKKSREEINYPNDVPKTATT